MNAIVACPKCEAYQFTIPKQYIREAKTPNHLMVLLTEVRKGQKRPVPKGMVWGRCKKKGCDGVWWRPGWLSIKVPKYTPRSEKIESLKMSAEDFD